MFSLVLAGKGESSITLGDSNYANVHKGFDYGEFDLTSEDGWAINSPGIMLGDTKITTGTSLFSTTSSFIELDQSSYEVWKTQLLKLEPTLDCDSTYYCGISDKTCAQLADTIPDLKIEAGDSYAYQMPFLTWSNDGWSDAPAGCSILVSEV